MDINRLISEKYTSSFMNNSKWVKLMDNLTENIGEIFLNYKLIYTDDIISTSFIISDFKPFFDEPTLYKEIEWIEFTKHFATTANQRSSRRITKTRTQNLDLIVDIIENTGTFAIEKSENKIRLYAYR